MDSHPSVAVSDDGAAPRYLAPEHLSDYVGHGLHYSSSMEKQIEFTESRRKQYDWETVDDIDNTFSHQLVPSLRHPTWKYCNGSITDASCERSHHSHKNHTVQFSSVLLDDVDIAFSTQLVLSLTYLIWKFCNGIIDTLCAWRKPIQIIKPNRKRSHHSHKNHTVQFSSVLLDENLEPRIYDTDVSRPFDQNHICNPQSVNQMGPIWILASVGVAKEQIIKSNSSVQCPLVEMLLLPGNSKVTVSRWGLNQMTRYLKRNGTFRRCSSLFIRTETPTEKKTVANGNGKGADNGSSKEALSYQANDSLNAPVEKPMSQSESSISSRPDETTTVDNSSATPTTKHEPTWYIVSAAAHHMTGAQGLLIDYMAMSGELNVYTPNMGCMQVLGSGSVNSANVTLQDVWYVPGLDSNLVSTSQLTKLGYTVSLGPDGCHISKDSEDGALVGLGHFTDDDLCAVDFLNVEPTN